MKLPISMAWLVTPAFAGMCGDNAGGEGGFYNYQIGNDKSAPPYSNQKGHRSKLYVNTYPNGEPWIGCLLKVRGPR